MGPGVQHASEQLEAPIELRIYPGADGDYTWYEHAGEDWGCERGEYALTDMHWDDAARRFKVVVVAGQDGKATDLVYDGRAVTIKQ